MTWVLAFIFVYMAAAAWDVKHVNDLLSKIAMPGPRRPATELPPAPRLVINPPDSAA